jgi:multidrug efflux pump subunit AcrA (membrane-fusion protein)
VTRYQKTHDGLVIVEGGGALYIGTAAEFAQDRGAAAPGALGIIIAPGRFECMMDVEGNQGAHGLSIAQRNAVTAIIAAAPILLAAKAARDQAARDAAQAARDAAQAAQAALDKAARDAAEAAQAAQAALDKAARDAAEAALPVAVRRQREMVRRGMTAEAVAFALLNNDIVKLAALRAIRDAVNVEVV